MKSRCTLIARTLLAAAATLLVGHAGAAPAFAQQAELYNDAWSQDTEIAEEDPPGWYWGYGASIEMDCNPGDCISEMYVVGTTRDTGGGVLASSSQFSGGSASITIVPTVAASMPDGDYPFTTDHSARYIRPDREDYNWWQFIKDNLLFKGINNRYRYSHFDGARWVFVRDDCHATCQTDSQYLNFDPGVNNGFTFLHRKVKRVSIFGIGKCFNARLTPQNYRGVCTT